MKAERGREDGGGFGIAALPLPLQQDGVKNWKENRNKTPNLQQQRCEGAWGLLIALARREGVRGGRAATVLHCARSGARSVKSKTKFFQLSQ